MLAHENYICNTLKNKLIRRIIIMSNYTQRGKKYIYSVERANELIQLGYRCIETGFNAKGQKFFWVFKYEDIDDYYANKKSN